MNNCSLRRSVSDVCYLFEGNFCCRFRSLYYKFILSTFSDKFGLSFEIVCFHLKEKLFSFWIVERRIISRAKREFVPRHSQYLVFELNMASWFVGESTAMETELKCFSNDSTPQLLNNMELSLNTESSQFCVYRDFGCFYEVRFVPLPLNIVPACH